MAKQGGGGQGQTVLPCNCKSPYQDNTQGPGRRIHTNGGGTKKTCTVCGKVSQQG